jgi:hypothetical protein
VRILLSPIVPCDYSLSQDLEVFFVCHRFKRVWPMSGLIGRRLNSHYCAFLRVG